MFVSLLERQRAILEVRVLACRLELKWSQDKSTSKVFTCFVCVCVCVCVLMIGQTAAGGRAMERVQISILAKGRKIEFFGIIR